MTNQLSLHPDLQVDVLIVGAGPVGLFLGCRLAQLGVSFKIVEKRSSRFLHSRSIGIHPPSLEKLEVLSIIEPILQRGIQIKRGHGFINSTYLGVLDFTVCPKPYNFIISLPQFETEAILEKRLSELAPGALKRGLELTTLQPRGYYVSVQLQHSELAVPTTHTISAKYIVGCDGKDSRVRHLAGIGFDGKDYPDYYLMGDFRDNTNFGADAAIYLSNDGLVESFPLSAGMRRWVAKTPVQIGQPTLDHLTKIIQERVNHRLPSDTNTMLSSFGVQRYLATPLAKNRIFLAGDAGHIISPIGGQGMNLGWLDAWDAAAVIGHLLKNNHYDEHELQNYSLRRLKAANIALSRAEFNMRMGRKTRWAPLKYALARVLIRKPFVTKLAHMFTMRGL